MLQNGRKKRSMIVAESFYVIQNITIRRQSQFQVNWVSGFK